MMKEEVFARLNKVFQEIFDDNSIAVNDDTTAKEIDGWDSLMHITLISDVEEEFDIHFPMRDVAKMQNVGEMVDKIIELVEHSDSEL